MSLRAEFRARQIGSAALAALRALERARVFAAFKRSFYVETPSGIACVGGHAIGRGPLNVIVRDSGPIPPVGSAVEIDVGMAEIWRASAVLLRKKPFKWIVPTCISEPWRDHREARAFLDWLVRGAQAPAPRAANALIGLGPGLTPAGDDFVGGALIALHAAGDAALADRVAAWALALAEEGTGKVSRAHLRCAAAGEGHEALHDFLSALKDGEVAIARALDALSRVGHSSGLDAAAGALLALDIVWRPDGDSNPGYRRERAISRTLPDFPGLPFPL